MSKLVFEVYDSTVGTYIDKKNIKNKLQEYLIKGDKNSLGIIKGEYSLPVFITGWDSYSVNIPTVPFPMFVEQGERYLVTDARPYLKPAHDEVENYEEYIKNKSEFDFIRRIVIFTLALEDAGRDVANTSGIVPMVVFGKWISGTLLRAFSLNPYEQAVVYLVAAIYYRSLFYDKVDSENFEDIISYVSNTSPLKKDDINSISGRLLKNCDNVNDFIDNINRGINGPKLSKLNYVGLVNLISSSWYGNNAVQVVSAALEQPQIWMALVYTIAANTSYKRTPIFNIISSSVKRADLNNYLKVTKNIIDDYVE